MVYRAAGQRQSVRGAASMRQGETRQALAGGDRNGVVGGEWKRRSNDKKLSLPARNDLHVDRSHVAVE